MEKRDDKELIDLADLFVPKEVDREPVRISVSLDKRLVDDLKSRTPGVPFSQAIETIVRRALERGAA